MENVLPGNVNKYEWGVINLFIFWKIYLSITDNNVYIPKCLQFDTA